MYWLKSWKPRCPETLQILVREIITTYIFCTLCAARSAIKRHCVARWNGQRGSGLILTNYPEIMKAIRESDTLRKLWEKYSREYDYAKDISFDDTCNTIQTIMDAITV